MNTSYNFVKKCDGHGAFTFPVVLSQISLNALTVLHKMLYRTKGISSMRVTYKSVLNACNLKDCMNTI
jgi:hypothetical protein